MEAEDTLVVRGVHAGVEMLKAGAIHDQNSVPQCGRNWKPQRGGVEQRGSIDKCWKLNAGNLVVHSSRVFERKIQLYAQRCPTLCRKRQARQEVRRVIRESVGCLTRRRVVDLDSNHFMHCSMHAICP